jgi:hypothetical protein
VAGRFDALIDELRAEVPGLRVVAKADSRLQRAIHRALVIATFGRMQAYLDDYVTTIGETIYVPADWDARPDDDRWATLRHEAVHLRQFQRWTLPGMAVLYLLVPLPVGLAWCRARFEWEAYEETIRAELELRGLDHVRGPLKDEIVRRFTGPDYGWMWPFRRTVERWYDDAVRALAGP